MLLLLAAAALPAAAPPRFRPHVIEANIPGGYQVLAVDLNRDGKLDVIGLSGRGSELYWYENPSWERRVLVAGMSRMITLAAADLDGDGVPEIALGTGFGMTDESSEGRVYLLRSRGAPAEPWKSEEIDRLPSTHRMRFADLDGDSRPELINSPLSGPGARRPLFDRPTPLVFYSYKAGEWTRRLISERLDGVVHGMREFDWDGDGRFEILTASFGGIDLYRGSASGNWTRTKLVPGDPAPRPRGGASEIRVGRGPRGRFLATIEPWHGSQVVVYVERSGGWERRVIDDSLVDGHALETADFTGDGVDEIVAGFRGQAASLFLYQAAEAPGEHWKKQVLDQGGMAAAGCDTADLNADGLLDLVCIGARTANIKWYENLGVDSPTR